eukprot:1159764-Pelagomonas_calceolata.AAC.2
MCVCVYQPTRTTLACPRSFLSRARTLLVKLRQQTNEIVQGALQQGTQQLMLCLEEELEGGGSVGAAATSPPTNHTDFARSTRVTNSSGLGMLLGSANSKLAQGGGANGAGKRSQGVEALGGATFGGIAAEHPIVANMGELGHLVSHTLMPPSFLACLDADGSAMALLAEECVQCATLQTLCAAKCEQRMD